MSVYVDDMEASFRCMTMCHMVADTTEELLEMADRIGMARRWIQDAGTYREHFDVPDHRRALAVQYGAIEVTMLQLGRIVRRKRERQRVR